MKKQSLKKYVALAILVGFVASLFYIFDFLARVMPSAMTQQLMQSFQVHAGALGILSSLFFYGYAPMQIPAGVLLDKLGPRKVLTLATLFSALATLGFAYTEHLGLAMLCRFIMGFMAAFAYIGALKVGAHWFKAKYYAIYASLVQVLGCVGAIIGEGPVAKLTAIYGWKMASIQIAIVGFVFTLLILLIVRNHPPKAWAESIQTPNEEKTAEDKLPFWHVFKNRHIWTTALFGFAIWSPITIFAVLWGVPFLSTAKQLSNVDAASMLSFVWIGIAVGGPLITSWSSWIDRRRLPMIIAALIGLITAVWIINFTPNSNALLIILLLLFGAASSSMALCFGLMMDTQPKSLIATASGFINMAIVLGGLTFQPAAGYILQGVWQGNVDATGTPIYTLYNYHVALIVVPIAFLIALFAAFFLVRDHRAS